MKRNKELIVNTAIITIGKISTQIINFILLPLYTAKLSTVDYGNYDFITTISYFIVPFITMLLEESMFRFLIDAKNKQMKKQIISITFIYSIMSTFIISIVAYIIISIIKYELGKYIIIYTISCVIMGLANALARGEGKIKLYAFANFLLSALIIMLNLILILVFKLEFKALIISSVCSHFIVSLFILIKLKIWKYITIKNLNCENLSKMLKYSMPLVPNTICWTVMNASDRLIIMSVLGASFNGIYSIAYKFPNIINSFYSYFNTAWRETSVKIYNDGNNSEFDSVYMNIKNILFAITICVVTIMPFIFPILIDETYIDGIKYIPILAISVFYSSIAGFYGGIFSAFKDTKIIGRTSFVAAILNIIINMMLIKYIGLFSAAISTLISSYVMYLLRKRKVKDIVLLKDSNKFYFMSFVIICIMFYLNIKIINILMVVISIIISITLNKNAIKTILKKFKYIIFEIVHKKSTVRK